MLSNQRKASYGNWVSPQLIGKCLTATLVFGASAALMWGLWNRPSLGIVLAVLAVFFMVSSAYFVRARHLFSDDGCGIQAKIVEMLLSRVYWSGSGKALDIGCGSGPLGERCKTDSGGVLPSLVSLFCGFRSLFLVLGRSIRQLRHCGLASGPFGPGSLPFSAPAQIARPEPVSTLPWAHHLPRLA